MSLSLAPAQQFRKPLYSVAMPIAGILYVAVGLIFHTGIVWAVGALLVGNALTHP